MEGLGDTLSNPSSAVWTVSADAAISTFKGAELEAAMTMR